MTLDRIRAVMMVLGLAVHVVGLGVLVAGVLTGTLSVGIAGGLAFAVGGAWGWGMVRAASEEAAEERRAVTARREYEARNGFRTSFDDEVDGVLPTPVDSHGGP